MIARNKLFGGRLRMPQCFALGARRFVVMQQWHVRPIKKKRKFVALFLEGHSESRIIVLKDSWQRRVASRSLGSQSVIAPTISRSINNFKR